MLARDEPAKACTASAPCSPLTVRRELQPRRGPQDQPARPAAFPSHLDSAWPMSAPEPKAGAVGALGRGRADHPTTTRFGFIGDPVCPGSQGA